MRANARGDGIGQHAGATAVGGSGINLIDAHAAARTRTGKAVDRPAF
jgi:hypothetical protein